MRLDHLRQLFWSCLDNERNPGVNQLLENSVVHLKSIGTDRLGIEDKIKEFKRNLFYLWCIFEIVKSMVHEGGESQDQDPTLRNRQMKKLRLLV